MSCKLVSITGGVASCSWSDILEPSSWDFIAVSEPQDDENYVVYSYNEEETATGTTKVDCSGYGKPGMQYVIRYFNRDGKKVCDSAPFAWSNDTDAPAPVAPADVAPTAPVAPVGPVGTAGPNLGVMSCTLVSITGGVASCTWSGIPGPTDSDMITVSEPQADKDNYVSYSYNEEGTVAGTAKVDCSGGYATPGKRYVVRYFSYGDQGYKKVCDSAPFIWSNEKGGDGSDAPASAVNLVGTDGRLTPIAHTKLFPFLAISNVLFFAGFPMLLYYSYGRAQCSTGPPNLAYGFLLLMAVFLTMGEIFISRRLRQPRSSEALQGGYQELQQSETWKIFDVACNHVFARTIFEAKMDHYIFLGLFGRLELSDGNSDALQPGQVRACEVDGSIDESVGNITLSQAFLILAIFALVVQGFFALRGIIKIRNLSAAECELDQAPDMGVFSQSIQVLTDGYAIAAEVAEGVGANVLCRVLEQASEAATDRLVKAGQDLWKNTQLDPSAQQDVPASTYEEAMDPAWKTMEDNLQTYRDMAKQNRETGDEEQALYFEDLVKQMEKGIEESKQYCKEGVKEVKDYYGTTNMNEVADMQQTLLKTTKSNEVVFRSVFNKVLCEAAPSLFLLTAFLNATMPDLKDIAKIKVIFSFSLSIFTCLSKAAKCFKMAKDPLKKQYDVRVYWKEVLLGILIVGVTAAAAIRFVGVIKNADW